MTDYRIFETKPYLADLENLPHTTREKVIDKLRSYVYPQMKEQPYFGPNIKKLKDWEPETWRYRIRDWRFFYEIDEAHKIIYMTAVDQRKDAY